jgi:rhodanese-related sulfurtransferase
MTTCQKFVGLRLGGAALLAGAAILSGTLAQMILPRRIPWVENWAERVEGQALAENLPVVSAHQVSQAYLQGGHVFADARPAEDFAEAHLPGAVSIPIGDFAEAFLRVQMRISPTQPFVVYCSGPECDESLILARWLKQTGVSRVSVFVGGMEEWREAGYPIEGGAP